MVVTGPSPLHPEHPPQDADSAPEIPSALAAGVRRLHAAPGSPPDLRRELVALAGSVHRARRRRQVWIGAGSALAASLALVVGGWALWARGGHGSGAGGADGAGSSAGRGLLAHLDPMDLNADGRVDMLDALIARRRAEAGQPVTLESDGAGDGIPSTALGPVERIARRAVTLSRAHAQPGGPA